MSDYDKLVADIRESFGKGAARKLRASGKTPAVIYGHGTDPVHVALNAHALGLIVRRANALIDLDINGKNQLVLVKDVQRDPVRQIIEHVDLVVIKKGETVEVEVPVHVEGTSFSGTNALLELATIYLSVPATSIPENILVDVEGLEEGSQIHVSDLALPKGATALDEGDQLVIHVVAQKTVAEEEEDLAGDSAAAEPVAAQDDAPADD